MGQIVIPAALRPSFAAAAGRQELRDEAGNLIGYFDPAPRPGGKWGSFTDEEVERAFNQTGRGRTLDDIYRDYGHIS